MAPLVTVMAGISDSVPPLLFGLGLVVGAGIVVVVVWLRNTNRNAGSGMRRAGYVVSTTLSAVQAVAVTIAALLAVDFFLLGPTLTESLALAQRIDRKTVESAYGGAGAAPGVVIQTLVQLEDQTFPLTTGATFTTAGGVSLKVGQQPVSGPQSGATSIVDALYPINKLCAGSGAVMVDVLSTGACAAPALFQIPFYDRVLLGLNEQSAAPLGDEQLRQAAGIMARAVRLRATVTLSNTGRSAAQNVALTAADQYSLDKAQSTSQTSISPGASLTYVFDGPIGTANQSAAGDPTFPFKSDPTGPVDPAILSLAVGVGAFVIVVTAVLAVAGADRQNEAQ